MHFVKSLEDGNWWDSARRVTIEVASGDIVEFKNVDDAMYFGDGVRGEPVSAKSAGEDTSKTESAPSPKSKRKKKDTSDVQEEA